MLRQNGWRIIELPMQATRNLALAGDDGELVEFLRERILAQSQD